MATRVKNPGASLYAELLGPVFTYYAACLDGVLAGLEDRGFRPLFVARGGHTLKQILVRRHRALGRKPAAYPTAQLSRVITTIATFATDPKHGIERLNSEIGNEPARAIVEALLARPFALNGINAAGVIASLPQDKTFAEFLRSGDRAVPQLIAAIRQLSGPYATFVRQTLGDKPTALVDTGWTGSIQDGLSRITGTELFGVYLARSLPMRSADIALTSIGVLFDDNFAVGGDTVTLPASINALAHFRHLVEDLLEPECETAHHVYPDGKGFTTNQASAHLGRFSGVRRARINAVFDYVEAHSADGFATIRRAYADAADRLVSAILDPGEAEIAALGSVSRQADFGKGRIVDVLIEPKNRFDGDNATRRIQDSLWPAAQRKLEAMPPVRVERVESMAAGATDLPSVQVVTRTKDRPQFLRRALRSVASQTYQNYVMTVINDGGDPAPVDAAIAGFPFQDRIRVIHNPKSLGMEGASNKAIQSEATDYIVIHDDDDSWEPGFLAEATAALSDSPYDGIVTKTIAVFEELTGSDIKITSTEPYMAWVERVDITDLATQNLFPPIAFVFSRKAYDEVGGFDDSFRVLGDWDFNLRFAAQFKIGVLPRYLARYHQRPSVKSGAAANSLFGTRDLHAEFLGVLRQKYLRASATDPISACVFNALCVGQTRAELAAMRSRIEQLRQDANAQVVDHEHLTNAAVLWVENQFMRNVVRDLAAKRRLDSGDVRLLSQLLAGSSGGAAEQIMERASLVPTPSFFSEDRYLQLHPDVRGVVDQGKLRSGFEHFVRWGIREGRKPR